MPKYLYCFFALDRPQRSRPVFCLSCLVIVKRAEAAPGRVLVLAQAGGQSSPPGPTPKHARPLARNSERTTSSASGSASQCEVRTSVAACQRPARPLTASTDERRTRPSSGGPSPYCTALYQYA